MFECLLNIMKTAKITKQNTNVLRIKENNNRREFAIEESKGSMEHKYFSQLESEPSEGEFESESEASNEEESVAKPNSSERYNFYSSIQDPNVDHHELLNRLLLQKQEKEHQKQLLFEKLSSMNKLDNHSNTLFRPEMFEEESASVRKAKAIVTRSILTESMKLKIKKSKKKK
jgi:hypothetical protein